MKTYSYYPGCSVKGTAKQYEESLLAVFEALDLKLLELPDWNCCGATMYMSVDENMSFAVSARNLAIAEEMGFDLVAPCSACYLVLLKTMKYIKQYPEIREKVDKALTAADLVYRGTVRVRHPLEVLLHDVGFEKIQNRVRIPLRSFKIAPYYGCQIVRPYQEFDHPCFPETMDQIFEYLGAEAVDYPVKTRCCGGSLTGTIEEVGLRINYILLSEAQRRGANCIVTVCPLCQFNLEAYQRKILKKYNDIKEIPILYFTQILGLAFGIPAKKLGIKRSIIFPKDLMKSIEVPEIQTNI
jgi:heterodisulfide reductase subunit B